MDYLVGETSGGMKYPAFLCSKINDALRDVTRRYVSNLVVSFTENLDITGFLSITVVANLRCVTLRYHTNENPLPLVGERVAVFTV